MVPRRTPDKVGRRRDALVSALSLSAWTTVEELIARTGASQATIGRDLRYLEAKGIVRRDHGTVRLAEPSTFGPFLDDPGFREQVHRMASEKRRIGRAAAAMIQDGETIAIAPGTSTSQIAQALGESDRKSLTVVTNAVNVAMELSRRRDVLVHLAGGYLSGDWFSLVGPRAIESVRTVFTDKFFFSSNGVHPQHGVTDRHADEAAMNEAMVRQARYRVLAVDHSKFGQVARHLVCAINEVNLIITDTGATDEMIAPFRDLGIEILRV
jgi:DeoR family transcriptional regulator of aga operon